MTDVSQKLQIYKGAKGCSELPEGYVNPNNYLALKMSETITSDSKVTDLRNITKSENSAECFVNELFDLVTENCLDKEKSEKVKAEFVLEKLRLLSSNTKLNPIT
ncbi:hypothetical protein NPIL_424991 [Nephila pilipes]|uniref:Uncharacterized protein n=1 Tax=Nephila pilipes TaxID=299642 RepID=A0A8X6T6Q3_NEPPI|nr:hypothetical protein NPIL_424991 [Nephila pilipes]